MSQKFYVSVIFLSLLLSPFGMLLTAQQKINYAPLRCVGDIPNDFLQLSSEKVNDERKKIARSGMSRKDMKLEKEFALNSHFGVDEILYSGKVLYGDVLSVYITQGAYYILQNHPQLRKKPRFYALKTSAVNAFSPSQGIIFVSVGLISQVENEAQLAFVLCHEISHYVKRHSVESYKRNMDVIKGKGKFKQLNLEEKLKDIYSYSKENEIEADKAGLDLYLKTPYNTSAVLSGFDMLLYSYLPYDEVEWSNSELQDSFYKFPGNYTPKKAIEISADEDEDDEESTHPNVRKRKSEIEKLLENKNMPKGSTLYQLGEDYFRFIQQQSRVELFYILINNAQYEKAYYLSHLYKHNYGDTAYASKVAAYALYARAAKKLSADKENHSSEDDGKSNLKAEGAFYNVVYFFDKLDKEELAVLSVRTAWDAYSRNMHDSFYRDLFMESARNLFKYTDFTIGKFYQAVDTVKASDTVAPAGENVDEQALSKIEKLKRKKKKQVTTGLQDIETGESENYFRYAFIEQFKNAFFKETIEQASTTYKHNDEEEENAVVHRSRKIKRWHKKFGYAGNMDSLILVNPFFTKVYVGRKGPEKDLLYNEHQELRLADIYIDMARRNNIAVQPLNLLDKEDLTTEKFNQYALIMEWLTERLDNLSSDVRLFNTQYISEVVKEKGTGKLCLSGISYIEEGKEFDFSVIAYTLLFPPILPLYVVYQQSHNHRITLTTIIFDLNTGKLDYVKSDEIRVKYNKSDYLNSQIYSLFHQISRKTK